MKHFTSNKNSLTCFSSGSYLSASCLVVAVMSDQPIHNVLTFTDMCYFYKTQTVFNLHFRSIFCLMSSNAMNKVANIHSSGE